MNSVLQVFFVMLVLVMIGYVCYDRWQTRRSSCSSEAFTNPQISNTMKQNNLNVVTRPSDVDINDCPTVPLATFEPDVFFLPHDVEKQFPPIWIPINTRLAKVLAEYRSPTDPGTFGTAWTASQLPPTFEDVFSGYQRLCLRTIHLAFGRDHRILFLHKGNWHKFLPNLVGSNPLGNHFRADALPDTLRMDYVKSQILAHYGGYWVPPDTILAKPNIHKWMTNTVLPTARADPNLPKDVPLVVMAGTRELGYNVTDGAGGASTKWTHDTSFLFAEPHNPVMRAVAHQMQMFVTRSFEHNAYPNQQWFTKAMHTYSIPSKHGRLAHTLIKLPDAVAGAIDEHGDPVTVDHYFRQRPLEHLPSRDTRWFVVNSPDRRITGYSKYEWFAYLTEDAIVQSHLWISILYRRGLQLERAGSSGNVRMTTALHSKNHPLLDTWFNSW